MLKLIGGTPVNALSLPMWSRALNAANGTLSWAEPRCSRLRDLRRGAVHDLHPS
jgi:hypothetical protein